MKRRRIRYDRVLLLASILIFIGSIIGYTACALIFNNIDKFHKEDTTTDYTYMVTSSSDYTEELTYFVEEVEEESTEEDELIYIGEFKLTGYCPCYYCSEEFGTATATGTTCTAGRTVAVDPTVIPYGTHLLINGHEYIAEDCGGAIKENKIDVYCDTHEECFSDYCNGYADVYIIVGEEF